ncbi:unnamed protein product [Spirodela intermedia]|uniref:ENT domain-containing protein n=1 Tax=Spirodela intermedia TaxID=51605 RepID=A0A7I8IWS5_SPIIN|nr:unnamed protein product [Spirodela intermedia]CAA6661601.1 unnamed protein product [Spirodela intermedia]
MEFGPSDSSGTDDDLPPTHRNRGTRGVRVPGNGSTPVMVSLLYPRMHNDMETQIHQLEQEAYCSVLMAFKAQSDVITWEQESLITELRKELRVSDEEHRELLTQVNANDIIRRIRDWRKTGVPKIDLLNNSHAAHNVAPSPTVSTSRKKQKPPQSIPSLSPALHSRAVPDTVQPSPLPAKRGAPPATARSKKPKPTLPPGSAVKSTKYPAAGPAGRAQVANPPSVARIEPPEAATFNPLIGRKVLTRWPEDNNFYEAVITDYNPAEGLHALVYDINTKDETWEWVNLKEISPEDIRWEGEDPGITPHRAGHGGPGRGAKKPTARATAPGHGRGRGGSQRGHPKASFPGPQNGVRKKGADVIEILHTETLIKAVEKVFGSSHPDPVDVEKAKKALKGHEQSLIEAIGRIADPSDSESGKYT